MMKTKKEKKTGKKSKWKIIIIVVVVVAGLLGALLDTDDTETMDDVAPAATTETAEKEKEDNEKANEKETLDDIEAITYAQLAVKEQYPDAEFSKYFDEDYQVVSTDPRYKVEGICTPTELSSTEKFYVIMEFTNDDYTEYTLELVQVGDTVFID